MTDKKRCVIYTRTATETSNREQTIQQRRVCMEYINKRDDLMLVDKEYVDSCISGNTPYRPAFTQLLRDAEVHAMDCIVMTNATRLQRDDIYGNIDFLIQEFQRHGVTLMFVEHGWPYDPEDGTDVRSIVESLKRKLRAYSELAMRDDDG